MNTHVSMEPTPEQFETAAETLKLLADPTRLRILWALLHGEHSVGDLAAHVGSRPAAVSQHLSKLRLARLVSTRRDGTQIFYRAESPHIGRLTTEALWHVDHLAPGASHHAVGDVAAVEVAG